MIAGGKLFMAKGSEFKPRTEFVCVGDYDIPLLEKQDIGVTTGLRWIPYTSSGSYPGDRSKAAVHFFIYDAGFENIWDNPIKLKKLKDYAYVTTPDFSTYTDMPLAFQIWNRFRSHWIGCYMQRTFKLKVIPTLCWSTRESFKFTFDGIPEGSVCIANSMGIKKTDHFICDNHRSGLREAIAQLEPERILVYGGKKEFYPFYTYEDIEPFCREMSVRKKLWDARVSRSFPKDKTIFELD
jgi:hypothetical protein